MRALRPDRVSARLTTPGWHCWLAHYSRKGFSSPQILQHGLLTIQIQGWLNSRRFFFFIASIITHMLDFINNGPSLWFIFIIIPRSVKNGVTKIMVVKSFQVMGFSNSNVLQSPEMLDQPRDQPPSSPSIWSSSQCAGRAPKQSSPGGFRFRWLMDRTLRNDG